MATVNYSEAVGSVAGREEGRLITWAGMANGDVGQAYGKPPWSDRSVQIIGTFGSGGNVRILGSLDGANFATLTDPQGNAIDVTAAKIEQVTEATVEIKPQITAGDGTTSLTVLLLVLRKFKS